MRQTKVYCNIEYGLDIWLNQMLTSGLDYEMLDLLTYRLVTSSADRKLCSTVGFAVH